MIQADGTASFLQGTRKLKMNFKAALFNIFVLSIDLMTMCTAKGDTHSV